MNGKTIVLAADHAGFPLKNAIKAQLDAAGYRTIDMGTHSAESCDYPLYAEAGCRKVLEGEAELCVLCCGTGVGMSIAANKIRGIRAACCSDVYSARYTRLHNDANVLCLGARVLGEGLAWELVEAFVTTEFEGGKHARRVGLIADLEAREADSGKVNG